MHALCAAGDGQGGVVRDGAFVDAKGIGVLVLMTLGFGYSIWQMFRAVVEPKPGQDLSSRLRLVFRLTIPPEKTLVSGQTSRLRYNREKRLRFLAWRNWPDSCKIKVSATGLEGLQELWHEFVIFAARGRNLEILSATPTM